MTKVTCNKGMVSAMTQVTCGDRSGEPTITGMALTSLLVCADSETISLLGRMLADLGIAVEQCGDEKLAESRLRARTFDAVLVDCKHEAAAMALIAQARRVPANITTLVIALVESQNDVRKIFACGANFILYKPIV